MTTAVVLLTCSLLAGSDMGEIRAIFQTNVGYDPRVDLAADAVMVHNHGGSATSTVEKVRSWSDAGYPVFRMFFSDSDAGRVYTTGKWDGKDHTGEAETRADGTLIECAGVRPYMIPTDGWTEYLETLAKTGLDAGAFGIVPEEPLSHTIAGYSEAFRAAYEVRFGEPWVDPSSSPKAWFRHSWVLSDLYLDLIGDLCEYAHRYGKERGRDVSVILPNHSTISMAAGGLVFPNAAACRSAGVDAFIGQVWTGPVAWSLGTYEGQRETRENGFFESAYMLYSSFAGLTRGTRLPMYFLIDPVEDDPRYQWGEYHVWYEKCIAACLMFPSVSRYEVMPWPDRIFLPGHTTGGGTPGPAEYRSELMAVGRALQEMEDQEEVEWTGGSEGIGVLVSDTLGWIRGGPGGDTEGRPGDWNNLHGLTLPLIKRGIPVQIVPIERMDEPGVADDLKVLLLSYNLWKPLEPVYHEWLAEWVRRGGVLVFSGVKDDYDDIGMWWNDLGYETPQDHLFAVLGDAGSAGAGQTPEATLCGRGRAFRLRVPPYVFSETARNADSLREAVAKAYSGGENGRLEGADLWSMRRGRYIAAYSFKGEHTIDGPVVNVFDPDLSYTREARVSEGCPGLFYLSDRLKKRKPQILFSSGRTLEQNTKGNDWTLRIAGPLETDGRVRVWVSGVEVAGFSAMDPEGNNVLRSWEWDEKKETFVIRFGFHPKGTTVGITFDGH